MKTVILGALALAATATATAAVAASFPIPDMSTLNPAALRAIPFDKIPWVSSSRTPGAETVNIVGDPLQPGLYVVMNRFNPGNLSQPHYNSMDRHIMVVSGTWWVSTTPVFDEASTVPMKTGTFVDHVARQVHYDGNRSDSKEPTVVMIFGMGPVSRGTCTGAEAEKGPGPCADALARAKAK